jgi:citrate lyase subunit beta/citryl-CoA lyase
LAAESRAVLPRIRSALFVPANNQRFLAKAQACSADAVILDLEDSVPAAEKDKARRIAGAWLASRGEGRPHVMARINHPDLDAVDADIAALMSPALLAVVVPKVENAEQVRAVADVVAYHEGRAGRPRGWVRVWPLVETLTAVQQAAQIAAATPRVAYMGGGTSERGDLARALHSRRLPSDAETLHIRSRVLLDVRAAGVHNPMSGLVARIDDLAAVEDLAVQSRGLGYDGMMVIHPSHIDIVNRVFSPSPEEMEQARRIVAALDSAEAGHRGATTIDGGMVDNAMRLWAEQLQAGAAEPRA